MEYQIEAAGIAPLRTASLSQAVSVVRMLAQSGLTVTISSVPKVKKGAK